MKLRRRPKPDTLVVFEEECPDCQRPILFELGQRENRCAWCGAQIVRLGDQQ